jgi:S-adenosylmethionine/arginine decarboxylase-like enzyme
MILKHEHLLVRAELSEAVRDTAAVEAWLSNLITAIEMQTLKGPFSIYSTMPGNTGITAGAILSTSHIMLHTFEDDTYTMLQLDVYSCSEINIDTISSHIDTFFKPYKTEFKFLDREQGLEIIEER